MPHDPNVPSPTRIGMDRPDNFAYCVTIYTSGDGTFTVSKEIKDEPPEGGEPAGSADEAMALARQLIDEEDTSEQDAMVDAKKGYGPPKAPLAAPGGIFGE